MRAIVSVTAPSTVVANRNSSLAPLGPRRRNRPSLRMRHARRGPSRLCSRQIAGPTRRDRHPIRGAGRHCRLPRNAGPCPHRRAFGELAGSLCNRRRDCRRRNRVRSFGGGGRPARCRTRWGGGARPVAGDGRDQTRVKQPVRRVGPEWGSASSAGPCDREGGAALEARWPFQPFRPAPIQAQWRRSSVRGVLVGSEASLLYATDSFTTPELCAPCFWQPMPAKSSP